MGAPKIAGIGAKAFVKFAETPEFQKLLKQAQKLPESAKRKLEGLHEKIQFLHPEDKIHHLRAFLADHGLAIVKGPKSIAHFSDIQPYHLFERGIKFRADQALIETLDKMEKGINMNDARIARGLMLKIKDFLLTGELKNSLGDIAITAPNQIEISVLGAKITGTITHTLEHGEIFVLNNIVHLSAAGQYVVK